ncbi:hypothetical protein KCP73_14460 [Salmonella enterica subsp. enterica]|nr:hypothetical protein KCP73_14460 [Salmonella enterica subsp. enterica]
MRQFTLRPTLLRLLPSPTPPQPRYARRKRRQQPFSAAAAVINLPPNQTKDCREACYQQQGRAP